MPVPVRHREVYTSCRGGGDADAEPSLYVSKRPNKGASGSVQKPRQNVCLARRSLSGRCHASAPEPSKPLDLQEFGVSIIYAAISRQLPLPFLDTKFAEPGGRMLIHKEPGSTGP